MKRSWCIWMLFTIFFALPSEASAEGETPIADGERIRVKAPTTVLIRKFGRHDRYVIREGYIIGAFVSMVTDTLTLLADDHDSLIAIPLSVIKRIDLSWGTNSRGEQVLISGGKGFVIGAAVGGVLALVAIASHDDKDDFIHIGHGAVLIGLPLMLGSVGFVIGAISGVSGSGEQWKEVPVDRLQTSFPARSNPLRFAVSIKF